MATPAAILSILVNADTAVAKAKLTEYQGQLDKAAATARKPIEAHLGGRFDPAAFDAYQRKVDQITRKNADRAAFKSELGANYSSAGFNAYERQLAKTEADTKRRAAAMQASLLKVGKGGALAVAAVGVGAVALSVKFDAAMRNVNSIAQLPEKRLKDLEKQVLSLAGKTAQAPQTLAEGLYDLVSSGFDAKQSMTILASSAKAATAGLTDTATSTHAVAAVLNAYRLPASDAAKVSDTLFKTVDLGVLSFEQLASTIGDVLPFASQLHVNLNEVGAAIATMTKAGLSPAETMTRIKQVMVSMLKPSTDLAAAIKQTGFENGAALIKAKGFQGALEAVSATANGSKTALAAMFPNVRALGGALSLTGSNTRAADKDLKAFANTSGATNKALQQQAQSTSYQWNKFKDTAEAAAIALGNVVLPVLNKLLGILTTVLPWMQKVVSQGFDQMKKGAVTSAHTIAGAFNTLQNIIRTVIGFILDRVLDFLKGLQAVVHAAASLPLVGDAFDGVKGAIDNAVNSVQHLRDGLNGLPSHKVTTITIDFNSNIPGVQVGPRGVTNAGSFAVGGMVTQPMFMVGEEAPRHPEYVLATNPAYRDRNLGLWAQAGSALGVPGFAAGGVTSQVGSKLQNMNWPGVDKMMDSAVSYLWNRYAAAEGIASALQRMAGAGGQRSGKAFQHGRFTFPLPAGSWTAGRVDQGWDLSAPAHTPELALANGVIAGHGIGGFGPWAPILRLASGQEVYYGHAGPGNWKPTGAHVMAGEIISEVGAGIVGISTGPHLEIGFYPPGGMGAGAAMKAALGYAKGGVLGKVPGFARGGVVTASYYTDHGTGAGGLVRDVQSVPGFAELRMGHALGDLRFGQKIDIKHGSHILRGLPKLDIGLGGGGLGGHVRAIDLTMPAARAFHFPFSAGLENVLWQLSGSGSGGSSGGAPLQSDPRNVRVKLGGKGKGHHATVHYPTGPVWGPKIHGHTLSFKNWAKTWQAQQLHQPAPPHIGGAIPSTAYGAGQLQGKISAARDQITKLVSHAGSLESYYNNNQGSLTDANGNVNHAEVTKQLHQLDTLIALRMQIFHAWQVVWVLTQRLEAANKLIIARLQKGVQSIKTKGLKGKRLGAAQQRIRNTKSLISKFQGNLRSTLGDVQSSADSRDSAWLDVLSSKAARKGVADTTGTASPVSSSTAAAAAPTAAAVGSDPGVALLQQLLTQAQQTLAVSQAQYKVFAGLPSLPKYAAGGLSSGGWAIVGERGPELAHLPGGTRIYSHTDSQQMSQPHVVQPVLVFKPGTEWLKDFVDVRIENQTYGMSRRAGRTRAIAR